MAHTKRFDELNLHFYPIWKEKLKEKAIDINLPQELIASCSLEELFKIIQEHEKEQIELTERTLLEAKRNSKNLYQILGLLNLNAATKGRI